MAGGHVVSETPVDDGADYESGSPESLLRQLPSCMVRDRYRLQRKISRFIAPGKSGPNNRAATDTESWHGLCRQVARSRREADERRLRVPAISYPEDLPITARRQEILDLLLRHQVLVVVGETGSGKTTQLPKICLEGGRGITGLIGHTQPRRIAARTVAQRVAEELGESLGQGVGYQVRFKDHSAPGTLVKMMTDGILLAEIQRDRFLNKYDTIIVDEAHERSLNVDFLLGYLKRILPQRPDLKVIITSATIDAERFAAHFDNAPVVTVSGRTYPVSYRYCPPTADESYPEAIVEAVSTLLREREKGDILVFLSGEREIREAALHLRRARFAHVEILPLYARLSLAEQNRVFQPHRGTRVVLATNVAETSLTVPGIRYVVDTGLARISRYSYRTKVQQLPIEPIARASADQRAGRCGRLGPGVCVRLYSEDDYQQRPAFAVPEIMRTNLSAVILKMLHLRLGSIDDFPFVDAPDRRQTNDGLLMLRELQAVDRNNRLTETGRRLAGLSIDPRFGRMLLAAAAENCLDEVLTIVAALSIADPRERPADKRQAADEKHRRWQDKQSDFCALLNLWTHFEEQRQQLSRNQYAKYCRQSFVSYLRMMEWRDLRHQLHQDCRTLGIHASQARGDDRQEARASKQARSSIQAQAKITVPGNNNVPDNKVRDKRKQRNDDGTGNRGSDREQVWDYAAIHRALLTGLLAHVGFRNEEREFAGVRNRKFLLFPGSGLAKKPPKWVVSAELVETARLFGHYNAAIDPAWLPPLAKHLVKKHYSEPHYSLRDGRVVAFEKQTLYGLPIVQKRRVNYAPIEPHICREVFVRSALVEGLYLETSRKRKGAIPAGEFAYHNKTFIGEQAELEERMRQRDIVIDDEELFDFYNQRIPAEVVDLTSFERWRKKAEAQAPKLLFIDREEFSTRLPSEQAQAQFPKSIRYDDRVYLLRYRFEPGHSEDGVSVEVPIANLHQVPEHLFDWLVPGLLRDKCIALVKTLAKELRKQFVPVPEYVDRVWPRLDVENRPLHLALAEQLEYVSGVKIPDEAWRPAALDAFYRANFTLLDENGDVLESDRDLVRLRARYRDRVQTILDENASEVFLNREVQRWDFGELAESRTIKKNRHSMRVYPALQDRGASVELTLCDHLGLATYHSTRGVVRLAMFAQREKVKRLSRDLLKGRELQLKAVQWPDRAELADDIVMTAIHRACFADRVLPRQQQEFEAALDAGKSHIVELAYKLEASLVALLEPLIELHRTLAVRRENFPHQVEAVARQLRGLFPKRFCFEAGDIWLDQYPKYIAAAQRRIDRHLKQSGRELEFCKQIEQFEKSFAHLKEREADMFPEARQELIRFRFMIEEFRVSHYAQDLKTLEPVSQKRLQAQEERIKEKL